MPLSRFFLQILQQQQKNSIKGGLSGTLRNGVKSLLKNGLTHFSPA